jgi:hypothetical protein
MQDDWGKGKDIGIRSPAIGIKILPWVGILGDSWEMKIVCTHRILFDISLTMSENKMRHARVSAKVTCRLREMTMTAKATQSITPVTRIERK